MLTHQHLVIVCPAQTAMIAQLVSKLAVPPVHTHQPRISLATLVHKVTTALPYPASLLLILEVLSPQVELLRKVPAPLTIILRREMLTVHLYPQASGLTMTPTELLSVCTRHTQTGVKLFAPPVLMAIFALKRLNLQPPNSHVPVAHTAWQVSRLFAHKDTSESKKEELLKLMPVRHAPPATTVLLVQNTSNWLLAHLEPTVPTASILCVLQVQPVILFTVSH